MGRRGVRWLVIAVVVLLAVLIGADRIGVVVAEGVAADTLQSSQHLPSSPDVDIDGFPFLTQLATGHYDQITVTATDVPVGRGQQLTISRLRVVLHDLTVSRSFSRFAAKSATATALIDYGVLGKRLGVELNYAGDGQVEGTKTVSLAGHTLKLHIAATPHLVAGKLGFTGISVAGAGGLTGTVVDALAREFHLPIPLDGIPFDVQLQGLSVGPDGVVITLAGSDLVYVKGVSGRAPS
jgi:hypothetical protein